MSKRLYTNPIEQKEILEEMIKDILKDLEEEEKEEFLRGLFEVV